MVKWRIVSNPDIFFMPNEPKMPRPFRSHHERMNQIELIIDNVLDRLASLSMEEHGDDEQVSDVALTLERACEIRRLLIQDDEHDDV